MVDPARVPGQHCLFVSGNDPAARETVARALGDWFGWPRERVIDLGDIGTARGTEMVLPLWIRLMGAFGSADFNFAIARATPSAPAREPIPTAR